MVDNPILYCINGKPSRSTTAAATAAAATAAGELDSPRTAAGELDSPRYWFFGAEETTKAPISCGPTEPALLLHWGKQKMT